MIGRAELRRQLEALPVDDTLERAHRAAVLDLLDLPSDITARAHYAPGHLTASAFVVSPDGTAVLLIHHAKLGRWLQPGGHIEPADASLLGAARRELREETGFADLQVMSAPFDVDVHEIPQYGAAPAHRHYDVRYLMRARDWAIPGGAEVLSARWFQRSSLSEMSSDESVWRALRKLENLVT